MPRYRLAAITGLALLAILACKGTPTEAPRDEIPEAAPPPLPPPPQIPSPVPQPASVDAAPDRIDVVADAAANTTSKSPRRKAAPARTSTGGSDSGDSGGLTAVQVTGNLPRAAADDVLRAKRGAFATCHAAAGRQSAVHGQVQMKLTLTDRGVVEIAKVMRSTLGGGDAELCLAHVAQRFKFPPPPGGGASTVTFQLKF